MEKLFKVLHKRCDYNIDKIPSLKEKRKKMEACFKEEKLPYKEKNDFAYFQNEIVYEGVLNKRAFEKAYLEGYAKMSDFFDCLDYKEKQRLMNYEIDLAKENMTCFSYHGQTIYIPFFDEKLNAIYEKEMVVFVLKQYRRIMSEYQDLMQENHYGIEVYKSHFSSFDYVYGYEDKYALYSIEEERLYFVYNDVFYDYITISKMDDVLLPQIAEAVFAEEKEALIQLLLESGNIDEKCAKKARKRI